MMCRATRLNGGNGPLQRKSRSWTTMLAAFGAFQLSGCIQDAGLRIDSPYPASGTQWYRGDLHSHTVHSDGSHNAEDTLAYYRDAGYDFVSLTDHELYHQQDGDGLDDWNADGVISPHVFKSGAEAYIRDYTRSATAQGYDWVTEEWNLSTPELLVIPGVEMGNGGPHSGCIGVETGPFYRTKEWPVQHNLCPVGYLAHPTFQTLDTETYTRHPGYAGYTGVEVFNALVSCLSTIPDDPLNQPGIDGTFEEIWDAWLRDGRQVWGYANTDMHFTAEPDCGAPFGLHAANVVAAPSLDRTSIMVALQAGSFYATSGVDITAIGVDGDEIFVEAVAADEIRFVGGSGLLATVAGSSARYTVVGDESYVRIEVELDEPVTAVVTQPKRAWSQPFWITP